MKIFDNEIGITQGGNSNFFSGNLFKLAQNQVRKAIFEKKKKEETLLENVISYRKLSSNENFKLINQHFDLNDSSIFDF